MRTLLHSIGLCSLVAALGGCAVSAASGADEQGYAAFRSSVVEVHGERSYFLVEHDLAIHTERELVDYYRQLTGRDAPGTTAAAGETSSTAQHLSIAQTPWGQDSRWPSGAQRQLTYCVSNGFGSSKPAMLTAMNAAAREWEAVADVRLLYQPAEDGRCNGANPLVLFDVRPASSAEETAVNNALANWNALPPSLQQITPRPAVPNATAFYPADPRPSRELIVYARGLSPSLPRTVPGILRHELGHALGFRHEHARGPCSESGAARDLTSYDRLSVMHYPQCGERRSDYSLTPRDVQGARSVYGRSSVRRVALFAPNQRYVAAEGGAAQLTANRTAPGPWETFELISLGGTAVALRATRGSSCA